MHKSLVKQPYKRYGVFVDMHLAFEEVDRMYDALYARQSIEKKDSISVESQLEYCRYETHGEACIEYTDKIGRAHV